jgi:hypothetical protein
LKRTTQQLIVSDFERLEFAAVVGRAARTGQFDGDAAVRALMSSTSFDRLRCNW